MSGFVRWMKKVLTIQGIVRMVADALLINLALVTSLIVRFLWLIADDQPDAAPYRVILLYYERIYLNNAWLFTLLSLLIFAASGFYTYGRFYRGRYKVLIVFQAVSMAYVLFGFLTYLAQSDWLGNLKEVLNFPRGALILSWALSVLLLVGARVWSTIWKRITRTEIEATPRRKIENVLVIGGAGYIGSALLPHLLKAGYRVRLLDLLIYGTEPIREWLDHPNLEIMQEDFRKVEKVVQAMQNMDAVIHLGGLVGDPACALNEQLTIEINLMATRMIAEVAKGSGVGPFIFASTCSVYGASEEKLDERSELRPVSLYARTKIASERVLLKMADDRFTPIILRLGTIYGISGRPRFDLVVNLLAAKAVIDQEITIFGGNQWRPFVHVEDAARAILLALEAPRELVRNQIFNVGSNEQNYTINQVGEMIQRLVPTARIVHSQESTDRRNYWVSFNKIRDVLGFQPQWTLEQGILQVIEAIRSGKIDDYRNPLYSNVAFLKHEGLTRLLHPEEDHWLSEVLSQEKLQAPLEASS